MDELAKQAALHSAGATVRHRPPFAELPSWQNAEPLSQEFLNEWVIPYYFHVGDLDAEWEAQLLAIKSTITSEVIGKLLGDFNWRTRQTGAFFAALTGETRWLDVIGTHLLKSEVCYAGRVYTTVLAYFNSPACADYLDQYLAYYLGQPDLWFDQRDALRALKYLDEVNGTSLADVHAAAWRHFVADRPHWSQDVTTEGLREQLDFISDVRKG